MIDAGSIFVDGKNATADYVLKEGMVLSFLVHNYNEPDLECDYHRVFENENIIVVSKPANLPISSNHRFFRQNMTALLRKDTGLHELNPIHRLDRETSGLLIFQKKRFEKPKCLRKDPRLIMAEKYYLAIVKGKVEDDSFNISIPLKDSNTPPIGYSVVKAEPGEGKDASTDFYKIAETDQFTLLLAKLNSGRKHQIRVHCALSGFPIVGDKLYSLEGRYYIKRSSGEELTDEDYKELGAYSHLLHAFGLKLELPEEEPRIILSEYFSEDFKKYLSLFGDDALNKAKNRIK